MKHLFGFLSVGAFVAIALACGDGGGGGGSVTLTGLTNGDAACYVDYVEGGAMKSLPGDFDLCQSAVGLIGTDVVLDIGTERILADSCQGDPECTETQAVDFVNNIRSP